MNPKRKPIGAVAASDHSRGATLDDAGPPAIETEDVQWWQRLQGKLLEMGWTKADLARHSGVAYDSINKYLRGLVDKPRGDILDQISRSIGKDTKWLLFGDVNGSTYLSNEGRLARKGLATLSEDLVAPARESYDLSKFKVVDWEDLPRFADSNARGIEASRYPRDRRLDKAQNQIIISVPDNSMAPNFRRGDLIVCALGAAVNVNDLVVASVNIDGRRTFYFRRYFWNWPRRSEREEIILNPINKAFPSIKYSKKCRMEIIGRIIGYAPVRVKFFDSQGA